jgi:hypothetical protein
MYVAWVIAYEMRRSVLGNTIRWNCQVKIWPVYSLTHLWKLAYYELLAAVCLLIYHQLPMAYARKAFDSSTMFERRNICSPKYFHNT